MSRAEKALSRSKVLGWAMPDRERARERKALEQDLREFLDATPTDVDADPAFKERLRGELLERLRRRFPER